MDYEDEREISLSSLFFYVLKQWRVVIVLMIIGALAGGIYKYISAIKNSAPVENEKIEAAISEKSSYADDSILLKLDLSEGNTITASYKFTMDGTEELYRDPVDDVICGYEFYLGQDDDFEALADEYETEVKYLKELYYVDVNTTGNGNITGNVLTLVATGVDKEMAQSIMQILQKELEEVPTQGCTITQIAEKNNVLLYEKLLDRQTTRMKAANSSSTEETKASAGLKDVIKWAIIGCLIGMVLAIIIYAIKYLVNQVLWNSDEFRDYYDYQVLGVFSQKPEKNGIDKWIQNWQKRITNHTDDEVIREALMIIHSKFVDVDSILLIGTISREKLAYVAEKIRAVMPEIKVDTINSIDLHAENLKGLIESDDVVIVEEREKSFVKDIDKEVLEIKQYDKRVLGCIVL